MRLPSWADPEEPKPAPEPLLLVQSFVNTLDLDEGTDLLASPDTAIPWLRATGLIGPEAAPGRADLERARGFRESLRVLLVHNSGGPPPGELAPIEAVMRACRPTLSIRPDGEVLLTGPADSNLTAGLLKLLLVIRDAQQRGTWPRLKACCNPDCRWAFFDRSHAHRGAWCDMAECGNVMKNRNFRARHK